MKCFKSNGKKKNGKELIIFKFDQRMETNHCSFHDDFFQSQVVLIPRIENITIIFS